MLAAGVNPLTPYAGKDTPWTSKCLTCGNTVSPSYNNVRRGQGACIYCSGKVAISIEDAFAFARRSCFEPVSPYPGSNVPWPCRCTVCGNLSKPRLSVIKRGGRCRYCAGNTIDPETAERTIKQAGVEPLEPYPGSQVPWRCKCARCGSEISPIYSNIRRGQGGCVKCRSRAAMIDESVAVSDMIDSGARPMEPYPGTDAKWRCKCLRCERIIFPRYANVRAGQGSCLHCRAYGIGDSAVVYLMYHSLHRSVKIGVAAAHRKRINRHRQHGWTLLASWSAMNAATAFAAEAAVLRLWRSKGIPDAVPAADMPQRGHTETAPLDLVDLAVTRQLVSSIVYQ